jgi:type IX secretion system PorP/SprF family membrane protein
MKTFLYTLLVILPICGFSQQNAFAPQGDFNILHWNPGATAAWNTFEATARYRQQWSGFANAPRTILADVAYPFIDYSMSAGIGLMRDDSGPLSENSIRLNYAYHIELGRRGGELSFGFSGKLSQYQIRNDRFNAVDVDDDVLSISESSNTSGNADFGIFYKSVSKDDRNDSYFYIGVAAKQILPTELLFQTDDTAFSLNRRLHGNMILGARFYGGYNHSIEPTFWLNYAAPNLLNFQLNVKYELEDKCWISLAYQSDNTIALQAGLIIPFSNYYYLHVGGQGGFNIGQLSTSQKMSYDAVIKYVVYL